MGKNVIFRKMLLPVIILLVCLCAQLSQAEDKGEILSGETRTGTIDIGQLDSFTFTGTAGQTVVIQMSATTFGFESVIDLFAPDGNKEISVGGAINQGTALLENHQLMQSGLYKIVARDGGGDETADYALSFLIIPGLTVSTQDPNGGIIASGETKSGKIDRGDTDAYTFDGTAGQAVVIQMSAMTFGFESVIDLYPPDGVKEISVGGDINEGTAFLENHQLKQSGLYTIVARDGGGDDTSDYGLSFLIIPGSTISTQDPNGGSIASGETKSGKIDRGDTDAYTFDGTAGQTVVIQMSAMTFGFESVIDLYAPDGVKEISVGGAINEGTAFLENHQLIQSGLYTIVARDEGGDETSDYGLSFLIIPGATISAQDPNGGSIASGETKSGSIDRGDTDAYTFNGTAGQTVVIQMRATVFGFESVIDLYAPDGVKEISVGGAINEGTALLENHQLIQSGLYTIVARDEGGDETSDYNLSLVIAGLSSNQPSITSFDPTSAATGETVVITGENFTGATAVSFGGTPAASFIVDSDTQISAVVGSGSSGNVTVTTPDGTASLSGFVFISAPKPPVVTPTAPVNLPRTGQLETFHAGDDGDIQAGVP